MRKILLSGLILFIICNWNCVIAQKKSTQKSYVTIVDTGFIFPNGHQADNYFCFIPSSKPKLEEELSNNDTLNYFNIFGDNCTLISKFDRYGEIDSRLIKTACVKNIDGDTIHYYRTSIKIILELSELILNNTKKIFGLEDYLEVNHKRKILINLLLQPIYVSCKEVKFFL